MATISSSQSISEVFEITAAAAANRDFLHVPAEACRDYAAGPLTLRYGEARTRIEGLASRLRAAGFRPGHRVALALDNRPEFFLYFLALARAQASVVPLNAAMSARELAYVIGHADVALVLTHRGHAAHLRAALTDTTPLHVLSSDGPASGDDLEFARATGPRVAHADEAALLYTSGTTGTPKGCILTNEYFLEIGRHYTGLGGYCRFDGIGDRLATPLPVTHMNALACSFMAMLMTGGCLIQLAWVNLLSVYALSNFPPRGTFSASKAAALSLSQGLRARMLPVGVRVINVFPGPIDDKLTPDALAESIIAALKDGVEDIYPGEVAQEWLARWLENPKMLERELGL